MAASSLPRLPPRLDLWPVAIQSAEYRRGTLVRCGPGLRSVAWPETPFVRMAAIRGLLCGGRIAGLLTAAWIWGAARDPRMPLEAVVSGRRAPSFTLDGLVRLHEFRLAPGDTQELCGELVTTPERTLYDLLRAKHFDHEQRLACRLLLAQHVRRAEWLSILRDTRQGPHLQRVLRRLNAL